MGLLGRHGSTGWSGSSGGGMVRTTPLPVKSESTDKCRMSSTQKVRKVQKKGLSEIQRVYPVTEDDGKQVGTG